MDDTNEAGMGLCCRTRIADASYKELSLRHCRADVNLWWWQACDGDERVGRIFMLTDPSVSKFVTATTCQEFASTRTRKNLLMTKLQYIVHHRVNLGVSQEVAEKMRANNKNKQKKG